MSFIAATETFYDFKKEQITFEKSKDVFGHKWMYDADDLQELMSHFQEEEFSLARLAEMGGIQGLAYALRTDATSGLGADEVEGPDSEQALEHRKLEFGRNEITRVPPTPFWHLCRDELEDPMLRVLIVAGLASMIIGAVQHPSHGWVDGIAVLFAVCIVVFVGAFNNFQKEKQFRSMEEESDKKDCVVLRNGRETTVPFTEVVVGDLVVLRAGYAVPCDGIFVLGTEEMKTDEAGLTGETKQVGKSREHPLFMKGTQVVKGDGLMLAVSVGDRTEWGQLMKEMQKEREDTPLQVKLEKLGGQIGIGGAVVAFLLFLILIIRWAAGKRKRPATVVINSFIVAITIVVVAVPEGLPLAVTISLAYSMKKMIHDKNFVRHHQACETMGNATTICSDKTGTLTQNLMSVTKVFMHGKRFFDNLPTRQILGNETTELVQKCLILNSKAFYEAKAKKKDDGEEKDSFSAARKQKLVGGNETECAMMQWALDLSGDSDYDSLRKQYPVTKFFPFDSAVKRSSVLVKMSEEQYAVYTKGAAEWLLDICSTYVSAGDGALGLGEAELAEIRSSMRSMTCEGLRCLGVSYKVVDRSQIPFEKDGTIKTSNVEFFFENQTWICVAGIQDRVRPEVPNAVLTCQGAGIVVRMVTGDHLDTAKHIARQCNIYTSESHVCMTGNDFRNLDKAQKAEVLPRLRVLARAKPSDKRELVDWYKNNNNDIVAVTGDGANDALALTEADVGLAMGIQGTDVAKEASDIVITDDNFASIVKTVMWGRSVYDNIRKFVQFQATVNFVALTISLFGAFFSEFQNPLTPVQLLWVNLIMDTMAALALATEPPTEQLLDRNPYIKDCPLISKLLWRFILVHGIYQLIALLVTMFASPAILGYRLNNENNETSEGQNKTMLTLIFNVFVLMQVFNEINARRVQNEWNVFSGITDNNFIVSILIITLVLQVLIVEFGGDATDTHGLNARQWAWSFGWGIGELFWGQFVTQIPVDMTDGVLEIDRDVLFKRDLPPLDA